MSNSSTMANIPGFIARIEEEEGARYFGTGFLVSPRYVLTCSHVAQGVDAGRWARWVENGETPKPTTLAVRFESGAAAQRYRGRPVAYGSPDIALIQLTRNATRPPVQLIRHLRPSHQDSILERSATVVGWPVQDPTTRIESSVERITTSSWISGVEQLCDLQLEGGRRGGVSGGPALVHVSGGWACFGMAFLGGDGASTTRLILADALLEFLAREGVDHPAPIEADDCFTWNAGTFIRQQRERRSFSRQFLASELRISESTLKSWEDGDRTPAFELRGLLFEQLVRNNPRQQEEFRGLLEKVDATVSAVDIVGHLRPKASRNRLRLEHVRANSERRGLGEENELRRRARFEIGSKAKILVELPWEGYATFLDIEGVESVQRSYFCLDPVLGLTGALPVGRVDLPRGDESLTVLEPVGRNCLLVLARRSAPFTWREASAKHRVPVSHADLLREIKELPHDKNEAFVAMCDYEVSDFEARFRDPWVRLSGV